MLNTFQRLAAGSKYYCYIATKEADKDLGRQLLREAYAKEHGHAIPFDDYASLVLCKHRFSGKVVGCMQILCAKDAAKRERYLVYKLSQLSPELLRHTMILNRMMITESAMADSVAFVMLRFAFNYAFTHKMEAAMSLCEPNLFPLYHRLGFRLFSPTYPTANGYRMITYFFPDKAYLKGVKSPLLRLIKKRLKDISVDQLEKLNNFFRQHGQNINCWLVDKTHINEHVFDHSLFAGLSKRSVRQALHNAVLITCKQGEYIVKQNTGGRSIGLLTAGVIGVVRDGKCIAEQQAGEIFGELAYITGKERSADLVVLSKKARVFVLSQNFLHFISNKNDCAKLLHNIANITANRLIKEIDKQTVSVK